MQKKGIVLLVFITLLLSMFVLADSHNLTSDSGKDLDDKTVVDAKVNDDIGPPPPIVGPSLCDNVQCAPGEFCDGKTGKCISTVSNNPVPFPIDAPLDECVQKCKLNFDTEDKRSMCIKGCKGDHDFDDKRFDDKSGDKHDNDFYDDTRLGNEDSKGYDYVSKKDDFDDTGKVPEVTDKELYEDVVDAKLEESAGLTPDNPLYFAEGIIEDILVGDNPQRALEYKEEKIREVQEMVAEGKVEEAKEALERAEKFSEILEKEVSPEIEKRARESSKAVKDIFKNLEKDITDDKWKEVKGQIKKQEKQEDRIAKAAKVSSKIQALCQELASLDPHEYARICKTQDDAPSWRKNLDTKLTAEQEEEAKAFFATMSQCFENPAECQCSEISVKSFAEKCEVIAPLAAKCQTGDKDACEDMEEIDDPIELLPDYLQDVLEDLEDDYGESKHSLHVPKECEDAGVTERVACTKIMFKLHAPPECQKALEDGTIDITNERDARKQCEAIMFKLDAPQECIEAGLTDHKECGKVMFKLDAPKECLDAGLDGSGRSDWKKCELIRFRLDAPKECLDAGLDGSNRNDWKKCEAIRFKLDAPKECLDAGIDGSNRDDWKKCDAIRFKLEAPKECLDAGIDPNDRNAWKKCKPIQFKSEVPQACLDAGLTGERQSDWRKCDTIRFKLDAPKECLDAGITGEGRDDWRKCDKIQRKMDDQRKKDDQGVKREDCRDNELHICDGGFCKCISKEDYDKSQGFGDHGDQKCAAMYCPQGTYCEDGQCKQDTSQSGAALCGDCESKCGSKSGQRLKGTSCTSNGCECHYEDIGDDEGSSSSSSSSGGTDDGTGSSSSSSGGDTGGTDTGSSSSSRGGDTGGDTGSSSSSSGGDSGGDTGSSSSSSGGDSSGDTGGSDSGGESKAAGDSITGGITGDLWFRSDFLNYYFESK